MSAEAPKHGAEPQPTQTGVTLLGFLRRLLGNPPQQIQPQRGLESFAGKIRQGIDRQSALQNQQELERRNAEAARRDTEAKEQAEAVEEQKKLEFQERIRKEQERIRKERAIAEGLKILQEFQIEERLKIIQQTAWEGKGKIKPINPDGTHVLGGFELVHQYISYQREEEGRRGRWRFADYTDSTKLAVKVLGQRWNFRSYTEFSPPKVDVTVETGKFLEIKSSATPSLAYVAKQTIIRVDAKDSKTLLEEALLQDTLSRVANQELPSQVEKRAREERIRLPHYLKWIYYYKPDSGSTAD